jgi:predicted permease
MSWFQKIRVQFRALFQKEKLDTQMDEEMQSHLEMQTRENIEAGMNPEEARYAARRQFGWVESIKDTCRDQREGFVTRHLSLLTLDIRHCVRGLRKNPGFTAVAVLTLALCLGANLAIFAVIDTVLLRPLPFPDPDRLVTMFNSYPKMGQNRSISSLPNYYNRRGNIPGLSHLAAFLDTTAVVGEAGSTELTDICRVSPEFFATLGVQLSLGRTFVEDEMTYQTDGVVILTDEYWRQKFNADAGVLGRQVRLDGLSRTVIGVLPPGFHFLSSKARIFHPLSSDRDERGIERLHAPRIELIARLKPDAVLAHVQSQIDAHDALVGKDFADAKIVSDAGYRTVVTPLHADHVASIRSTILLMQAGVFSLLLIGGVNLMNLLLIRASGRARELAIRQSLGATRHHLVRQVLVETVLLALLGGLLGLGVGAAGIRLLAILGVEQLPLGARIVFDGRLALVALLGALVAGLLAGLPLAWFNLRSRFASALQSESRGATTGYAAQRLRHGFVIIQIALAFTLLAGAGLLGLSLKRVTAVSPGFRADGIVTGRIALPWKSYPDWEPRLAFTDRLLEKVGQLPGVVAAGVITDLPLNGGHDYDVVTVDGHTPAPGLPLVLHSIYWVTGDYFPAMGIPLREGRFLERADSHRETRMCVVDEDFARTYWPQGTAIGQRVFRGPPEERPESEAYTVVGVVGAVKHKELTDTKSSRAIYFPYRHQASNKIFVVGRTTFSPETLGATLHKVLRQVDPELPLYDVRSMEVRIADSLVARRSPALLSGIFAAVALLLAAVGTYGVLSYAVAQRSREIGVRMALGARPGQIARQFLSLGLRLLAAGAVLGVIGAALSGRAMQGLLFDVPAMHVPTLVGIAGVMSLVTLAASLLPASRASRVHPMEVLRAD